MNLKLKSVCMTASRGHKS